MTEHRPEGGFSLVEILVALAIFATVSAAFMSVMLSGARSSDTTRDNVRVAEEARLGINRMVRDTREAGWIALPSTGPADSFPSFTVKVDFNGDGTYSNPAGPTVDTVANYEVVTYAYDDAGDRITLTAQGFPTETLVKGVDCVRPVNGGACTNEVFSFTSNRLEYDWDGNGVTTLAEINQAACAPYNVTTMDVCNTALVDKELANVTSVNFAFSLKTGDQVTNYFTEAQLRNRR
ncbi:MAG TPA: prepilin-type N-terminal cleavage/methylation domain-containing protein [Actinomycetota bacterium]|nr:prepilin-type N-terminal cleavage/methylation domain-containing protein [Actinomycetota bacterium]